MKFTNLLFLLLVLTCKRVRPLFVFKSVFVLLDLEGDKVLEYI